MGLHWDLLSLQDPNDPHKSSNTSISSASQPKGMSIREFKLVEPLGSGGYGTIWMAKRRRTEDLVAIKVLSRQDTKAKKMLASVHLERNILADADSPYVVKLFFSFATLTNLYMVMEYLPGGDCYGLLQQYGFLEESMANPNPDPNPNPNLNPDPNQATFDGGRLAQVVQTVGARETLAVALATLEGHAHLGRGRGRGKGRGRGGG